jgi:hypothetical protein
VPEVRGWALPRAGLEAVDEEKSLLLYYESNPDHSTLSLSLYLLRYPGSIEVLNFVGFEVSTAVVLKSNFFWDMTPCSP